MMWQRAFFFAAHNYARTRIHNPRIKSQLPEQHESGIATDLAMCHRDYVRIFRRNRKEKARNGSRNNEKSLP